MDRLKFVPLTGIFGFVLGFLVLMFTIQNINERFWLNDFKVMYLAAEAFSQGDSVYGVPFGLSTGYFKYSPVSLLFFTPYLMLDYYWASVVHFVLIGLVFASIFSLLIRIGQPLMGVEFTSKKRTFYFFLIFFFSVVVHLSRELHLGNVNLFLIFLFLQGFVAHRAEKPLFAGFYFALIVLTKPYWIMLVLPFLLAKEWKLIAYSLLHILILIGFSFFIGGFEESWNLYNEWIQAMLAHSSYLTSTHTWFGLAEAFFNMQDLERFSIPVFALFSVVLALIFHFSIDLKKRDNQFLLASLLLAMTPNFLITDTEHFLYSIPILIYLFTRFQGFSLSMKIALVLGLLAYAFNPSPQYGSLGIGNLALLTIFTILLLKKPISDRKSVE